MELHLGYALKSVRARLRKGITGGSPTGGVTADGQVETRLLEQECLELKRPTQNLKQATACFVRG
jgi:hypothetical protein